RLGALGFRRLASRDVDVHADPFAHAAVRGEQRRCLDLRPAPAAAGAAHAKLAAHALPCTHGVTPARLRGGAIVGMYGFEPAVAEPFLQALTGVSTPRRGVGADRSVRIGLPYRLRGGFHQQPEALLALAQRLLDALGC